MITKIKNLLSVTVQYLTDIQKDQHEKLLAQQQQNQQIIRNTCVYNHMHNLALELYEVFAGNNYPRLIQIQHPSYIRICNYRQINGCYEYAFTISKKLEEHIPDILLKQIQNNMNHDIAFKQQTLAKIYDYNYLYYQYPFLASGIYVTGVTNHNSAEVLVYIKTNIVP